MNDTPQPGSLLALNARLRSLEARLAEFERKHSLDALRADRAQDVRRHSAEINRQIDAAIARGDRWEMVHHEFERDFQGLSDSLDELLANVSVPDEDGARR